MLRRLLFATVVLAALAALASPHARAAVPPCPDTKAQSLQSAHFTVTFESGASASDAVTQTQAGRLLAGAERAYAAYAAMGFPAPAAIGGRTEIDVDNLTALNLSSEYCSGAFVFDSATIDSADVDYSISFDVFTQIELTKGVSDTWLLQGMGSWAAWKSLGFPADATSDLGPWDMTLDCYPPAIDSTACSTDGYANLGESRWPFYEYLAETYGTSFMNELMNDSATAPTSLAALQTALAAHGSTVAGAYAAFTTKLLVGNWSATPLNTALPPVTGAPILTGAATGDTPAQPYGVNHLATKYVEIDRGDGDAKHKCYAATLTVNVALPSGVTSQPVFYWAVANSAPVSLTVSGTNATATVPWDTCSWKDHGYLSLPNTTTDVDGALFQVSTHLDVSTTEVTGTPPSSPANGYGNATDVGSAVAAPSISVFGPLVLKLPSTATKLELVVESSDQGSLAASLGATALGSRRLVAGENVVRFALPKGILQRLRRSATTGANVLTLTPSSSDGHTTGAPVSVRLSVLPAQKHKPKPRKRRKH